MRVLVRADQLLRILAVKNKSQRWLAARLGVSSGYVSQICSCKRNPSPDLRQRLMVVLRVNQFEDLFEIQEKEDQETSGRVEMSNEAFGGRGLNAGKPAGQGRS